MSWKTIAVVALILASLLSGCTPSPSANTEVGAADRSAPAKKRAVGALLTGDLATLLGTSGAEDDIEYLVHAGLAQLDLRGAPQPQIAEAVPSVEHGTWKVLADGRMETTWRIRSDARWHDGTPVTAQDIEFGARVAGDPQLPYRTDPGWSSVDQVTVVDSQTVTITWNGIYILADRMFARPYQILPRHLLERLYEQEKERFDVWPYWTDDFVGAGPFKVRELVRGSHLLLDAFDGYVLGRPRLDEIEIRFIPDVNTLMANMLASAVDVTIGNPNTVAPDEVAQFQQTWPNGKVVSAEPLSDNYGMFPQQLNPSLPALLDPRFRKALLYALDREGMNQAIMGGLGAVSHTHAVPALPDFEQIQGSAVRYGYDVRRSAELLEEAGYRRGAGGLWEDAAGHRVAFEHWAPTGGVQGRSALVATDFWRAAGLSVEHVTLPATIEARRRAEQPGILTSSAGGDYSAIWRYFHSSFAPVAENRYTGSNRARYMLPEQDALLERWYSTVPLQERAQALQAVTRYQTENAIWMGYMYNPQLSLISNRLRDVAPSSYSNKTYDAHRWDLA